MSMLADVCRHRGRQRKGRNAERTDILQDLLLGHGVKNHMTVI